MNAKALQSRNEKSRPRPEDSLLARDLMVTRVRCVRPGDAVYDAVQMLVRQGISGAPVVDDDRRLVGMLSEKDCIQALMRAVMHDLPSSRVGDVMSTDLTVVSPETHILTIAHLFLNHPIRRIPVVDDDDRVVGVISRQELLRTALDVFRSAPTREAAILYLSAVDGAIPPS